MIAISELSKSVKLQQASASNKCQCLFLYFSLYLTESQRHQPAAAEAANAPKWLLFHCHGTEGLGWYLRGCLLGVPKRKTQWMFHSGHSQGCPILIAGAGIGLGRRGRVAGSEQHIVGAGHLPK